MRMWLKFRHVWFVRLAWRVFRSRKGRSCLLQPQSHFLVCFFCNATTYTSTDVASERWRTADNIIRSTQVYNVVSILLPLLVDGCTSLCPQYLLMYSLYHLLSINKTAGFKQQLTNLRCCLINNIKCVPWKREKNHSHRSVMKTSKMAHNWRRKEP